MVDNGGQFPFHYRRLNKTCVDRINKYLFEEKASIPPAIDGVVFNLFLSSQNFNQEQYIDKIWVSQGAAPEAIVLGK